MELGVLKGCLMEEGHTLSRKCIARLTKHFNYNGKGTKKFKPTTNSKHKLPFATIILERNFSSEENKSAFCR